MSSASTAPEAHVTEEPPSDACPACRAPARGLRLLLRSRYRLHRCTRCRTEFLVPERAEDDLSTYWERYKLGVYASPEVQREYEQRYRAVLERLPEHDREGRVLDTGCGIGNFVAFAERLGYEARGTDVDPTAVATARDRGLDVVPLAELDDHVADGTVELGTAWDVVEHVTDPRVVLRPLTAKVRRGGLVALETPDAAFRLRPVARWLRHLSGGRIKLHGRLYYWEHKVYFTEAGLRAVLDELGCDVVWVRRMTSPRAKMSQLFQRTSSARGPLARLAVRAWPFAEALARRLGSGNKLIVVARRR